MAPQPQKRAPGGGRKPKGPAAMRSQFTVRMPDYLRGELEAAAKERRPGWTLTDELLLRLRQSFDRDVEERRNPALAAILFLIGRIAENLPPDIKRGSEHLDPFWFASFRLAVGNLLEALQPPGEIRPPSLPPSLSFAADIYGTPEQAAKSAAILVLLELNRPESPPPLEQAFPDISEMPDDISRFTRRLHAEEQRRFYNLLRARVDLGARTAKSGKEE